MINEWAMTLEYYNIAHQHIHQWMPIFVSQEHCESWIEYFISMLENLNGALVKQAFCSVVEHVK